MSTLRFEPFWSRLEALADPDLVPPWLEDRQQRSRQTRERILDAAARLIARHGWAGVAMQGLADEAGVSIGALYARFPSRDAVLGLLGVVVFDAACGGFEDALASLPRRSSLARVIERYVATLVEEFVRHRTLIIEIRRNAALVPELRRLMTATNRRVHEAFYHRTAEAARVGGQRGAQARLGFALFMINAAAREAILAGAMQEYPVPTGTRALVAELTRAACGYLLAPGPAPAT